MGNWIQENTNDKVDQYQLHKILNVDLKIIMKEKKKEKGRVLSFKTFCKHILGNIQVLNCVTFLIFLSGMKVAQNNYMGRLLSVCVTLASILSNVIYFKRLHMLGISFIA